VLRPVQAGLNAGNTEAGRPPRALVTGASRGIGRAVAVRLAGEGYAVTLSARGPESLQDLAAELEAAGTPVDWVAADMSSAADLDRLAAFQVGLDPGLGLLVLCAGVGTAGPVGEFPVRRVERQLSVNFLAPFRLVQLLLPALRAGARASGNGAARVVALASITGVVAEAGLAA
jgi:3-oxoacyl-[acyl-carrier protein] reductase